MRDGLVCVSNSERNRLPDTRDIVGICTVTKAEISEIITHMAFYSGWPTAMTAAFVAKEVFEKQQ